MDEPRRVAAERKLRPYEDQIARAEEISAQMEPAPDVGLRLDAYTILRRALDLGLDELARRAKAASR